MDKIVLFVSTNSRFDEPLVAPVKKRLSAVPGIIVKNLFIPACDFIGAYKFADVLARNNKIDLAFTPFDRIEMLGAAVALFQQNIKLCQMHAGDFSEGGTWDDSVRWTITTLASLCFCNGWNSFWRTCMFKASQEDISLDFGFFEDYPFYRSYSDEAKNQCIEMDESLNIYEVGSTALDDIEPDYSLVGAQDSFDLVLYSAPTKRPDLIPSELDEIDDMLRAQEKPVVWIGPTNDPGEKYVKAFVEMLADARPWVKYLDSVPRATFLALIDRCDRFIGNSSSLWTEALAYKTRDKLFPIGVRNRGRDFVKPRAGGSDRIVEHVREFLNV